MGKIDKPVKREVLDDLKSVVPKTKTEFIKQIDEAKDEGELIRTCLEDFGWNKTLWRPWQLETEQKVIEARVVEKK